MAKKSKTQLLEEARELLEIAHNAMYRLRLNGQGGNTREPHEIRMFARHFTIDTRTDSSDPEFAYGHGTYQQWCADLQKVL